MANTFARSAVSRVRRVERRIAPTNVGTATRRPLCVTRSGDAITVFARSAALTQRRFQTGKATAPGIIGRRITSCRLRRAVAYAGSMDTARSVLVHARMVAMVRSRVVYGSGCMLHDWLRPMVDYFNLTGSRSPGLGRELSTSSYPRRILAVLLLHTRSGLRPGRDFSLESHGGIK